MENDIAPWLVLKQIKGLGNIVIKRLIENFGSPDKIFSAPFKQLCQIEGMTANKADNIKKAKVDDFIINEIKTAQTEGIKIVSINHESYPKLLKEIPDPPPLIYIAGDHPADIVSIAIVGSRKAGMEGRAKASTLSSNIAYQGIRITSGMALGIDGAAHYAALDKPGSTTAVLGSGLLSIYPREHKTLYKKIVERGAVISEFSLHTKPNSFNFPVRNRIISGISIGTIVVEAQEKSGAIITANTAADQGRDVFIAKLKNTLSPGTKKLKSLGTREIENTKDILDEYPWMKVNDDLKKNNKKSLDFNEKYVIKALKLSNEPLHIDEICQKCLKIDVSQILASILDLELKGIVKQLPGKFYYLIEE